MSTPEELEPTSPESSIGLSELVAMRRIPDSHAPALGLYVGHDREMSLSEWDSVYAEFMSKPTGMSKEAWHAEFVKQKEVK